MTEPTIEPWSPRPLANTLPTRLMSHIAFYLLIDNLLGIQFEYLLIYIVLIIQYFFSISSLTKSKRD